MNACDFRELEYPAIYLLCKSTKTLTDYFVKHGTQVTRLEREVKVYSVYRVQWSDYTLPTTHYHTLTCHARAHCFNITARHHFLGLNLDRALCISVKWCSRGIQSLNLVQQKWKMVLSPHLSNWKLSPLTHFSWFSGDILTTGFYSMGSVCVYGLITINISLDCGSLDSPNFQHKTVDEKYLFPERIGKL